MFQYGRFRGNFSVKIFNKSTQYRLFAPLILFLISECFDFVCVSLFRSLILLVIGCLDVDGLEECLCV